MRCADSRGSVACWAGPCQGGLLWICRALSRGVLSLLCSLSGPAGLRLLGLGGLGLGFLALGAVLGLLGAAALGLGGALGDALGDQLDGFVHGQGGGIFASRQRGVDVAVLDVAPIASLQHLHLAGVAWIVALPLAHRRGRAPPPSPAARAAFLVPQRA